MTFKNIKIPPNEIIDVSGTFVPEGEYSILIASFREMIVKLKKEDSGDEVKIPISEYIKTEHIL